MCNVWVAMHDMSALYSQLMHINTTYAFDAEEVRAYGRPRPIPRLALVA